MADADFRKLDITDAFKALNSNPNGISNKEVAERRKTYGYNEITEKRQSKLIKFLHYFWGPMPWLIEAASVLSAILQHWDDLAIILTLLLANAVIGFWQENKADNAIELLKKRLAISARVLRNGKWAILPARELVPGDVIRVRLGDIVPADIKLFSGERLLLDESALTGESLPAEKHQSEMTFSGAIVKQGEMDGVVTATGQNTYFGKTTKLVQEAKPVSHLQQTVVRISDYLIVMALVLVALVLIASVLRGEEFLPSLQFALILLVASIPVALPAVLSVTMAVGAVYLADKDALVTKLEAIEEIAGMDILCADKTGTITKNQISVKEIRGSKGFSSDDVILLAALASRKEDNDPLETAIFSKIASQKAISNYRVLKYAPFDPTIKRTEALCEDKKTGKKFRVTKGATQVIFSLISPGKKAASGLNKTVEEFAASGYRTIAVATGAATGRLVLVGLIALYDPPRDDARETISNAESMGIDVKMVTGDHVAIAREMCAEVGIGANIMPASALKGGPSGTHEMEKADAFAEVFPEHKYNIVKALQGRGHIVGMTGDGVNDSPALKEADAGIAVYGATDAARSAADIVLTAPGISVIVDAVKQGRMIFERMNSYATYRIAETIRVLIFLSLSILVFNIYPLTVLMLVLLALLNDFPIMMIAYDNAVARSEPAKWNMRSMLDVATLLGVVGVVSSFGMLLIGIYVFKLSEAVLASLIFLKMAVAGHLTIYQTRTGKRHFWSRPFPSGRLFYTAEITKLAATAMVIYGILLPALPFWMAAFVWAYSIVMFVVTDFIKVWAISFWERKKGINRS